MKRVFPYLKPYLLLCLLAQLAMIGEVTMDLMQPSLMSRIVDDGVLGLHNNGVGDLGLVISLGARMIGLVVLGACCGILCGVFSTVASQKFSNDVRKDCFRRVMDLSFEQTDRFSTGSLVTRLTNDVTQMQAMVGSFTRGIRGPVFFVGGIWFMLGLDLSFGAVVACALPLVFLTVIYFLGKAAPIFRRTSPGPGW